MTKTVEHYSQQALDMFEAGFTSKAGQKRAFEALGHAAALLRKGVHAICFELRGPDQGSQFPERAELAYWMNYDLHLWNEKRRAELLGYLPEAEALANQFDDLAALRKAVKDSPVVKVERQQDQRVEQVQKSIRELMAQRGEQYARGLKLCEIFKGLPVTANVHWVTNQHGTSFIRAFYYMAGTLTPLNLILAVLQENARRQEAAQA